jgi:GNAT superfamily N-acetyltransferase
MNKKHIKISESGRQKYIKRMLPLVLRHRLFVSGWQMRGWIDDVPNIRRLILCRYKGKPIAVGMRYNNDKYWPNTGIFVRPKFRRRGIGSRILKRLAKVYMPMTVGTGIPESYDFFAKRRKETRLQILY